MGWIPEPVGDLWDAVKRNTIDQVWPPDDEQDAWDLADAWRSSAKLMDDVAEVLEGQARVSDVVWTDTAGVQFATILRGLPENFRLAAENMRSLANNAEDYGNSLREARINIVMELAANVFVYAWLSAFPMGAVFANALARAIANRLTTMIGKLIGRTVAGPWARAIGWVSKGSVEAGVEALDESLINTATQLTSMGMGTRDKFDFGQLAQSAGAGALGGPIGEVVGKAMSPLSRATGAGLNRVLPDNIARNINAGISSAANNAVTSPTAGYVAQNITNLSALTDLGGYGESFKQNAVASALIGAPRSMVVDAVQQMNPDRQQLADDWVNRVSNPGGMDPGATEPRGGAPGGGAGSGQTGGGAGAGGNGQTGGTGQPGGAQSGAGGAQTGGAQSGAGGAQTGGGQSGAGGAQTGGGQAGGEAGGAQSGGAQTGAGGAQTGGGQAGGEAGQSGGAQSGGAQTGGGQSGGEAGTGTGQSGGGQSGGQAGGEAGTQTGAGQSGGAQSGGAQTGGGQSGSEAGLSGGAQSGGAQTGGEAGGAQSGGQPGGQSGGAHTGGGPAAGEAGGSQTGNGGTQSGGPQAGGPTGGEAGGAQTGNTGGNGSAQSGPQTGGPQSGPTGTHTSGEAGGAHTGAQSGGPQAGASGNGQTGGEVGTSQQGGTAPGVGQSAGQTAGPIMGGPLAGAPGTSAPSGSATAGGPGSGGTQSGAGSQAAPTGAKQAQPASAAPTHTQSVGKPASPQSQSGDPNTTQSTGKTTPAQNQLSNAGKPDPATSQSGDPGAQPNAAPAKTTGAGAAAVASRAVAAAGPSPANQQPSIVAQPTRVKVGRPPASGQGSGGNNGNTGANPTGNPDGDPEITVRQLRSETRQAALRAREAEQAAQNALAAAKKANDAVRKSLAEGTPAAAAEALAAAKAAAVMKQKAEAAAYAAEVAANTAEQSAEKAAAQATGRVPEAYIQRARDTATQTREAAEKALEAGITAWQAATVNGTPPPPRGDRPLKGDPNRQPDNPAVPIQPEVHILGTFSPNRLTIVDGVITEIDGTPVEEKLRELAKHRAELYHLAMLAQEPAGHETGKVVALVLNVRTGQVVEATDGQTSTEIPFVSTDPKRTVAANPVHPTLRAHESRLRMPGHYPQWNDDGTPAPGPRSDLPGTPGEPLFRHAAVRAANEHLHMSGDVELTDLLADSWQTEESGPVLAPFCANCAGVLPGVRNLSGRDEYAENGGNQRINTLPPELPDGTGQTAPNTNQPPVTQPPQQTAHIPPASPDPNAPNPPPVNQPPPPGGKPAPGPRSRVESVRPLRYADLNLGENVNNRKVEQRARDVITKVAEFAKVSSINPITGDRSRRFTVTRANGDTFTVRVISKTTGSANPAKIVQKGNSEFEIRISPRTNLDQVERVMANAVAQADAVMDGAPTTNLLDGRTHPGSNTRLSAEDRGRQAEVRYLDHAKQHTSKALLGRRHRIANEMRVLVEHLGLHPDAEAGPQRRAISDVENVVDRHVKEGGRRPAWSKPPDGYPGWRAFIKYHLVAEVMGGYGAAIMIGTVGDNPVNALGVATATTAHGVVGTIAKRWYDRNEKTNVDSGHGDKGKTRKYEAGLRYKELHDPIRDRLHPNRPPDYQAPAEPEPQLENRPIYQSWWRRMASRAGGPSAAALAAWPLMNIGLPGWNVIALAGVAGLSATAGTFAEWYIRKSMVPAEHTMLDNVGRAKDEKALEYMEYNAKRLSAFVNRLENAAGLSPQGAIKIATIVRKYNVNWVGLHRFGLNQAEQFGNLARSGAESAGKYFGDKGSKGGVNDATWNTIIAGLKTGALRSAAGMLLNAYFDAKFTAKEYEEIVRQFDHDANNQMKEQVETEQQAFDAMMDEVMAALEQIEADNRIDLSLDNRIAYAVAHPPRPPDPPEKSLSRPPGHQDRKAFRALMIKIALGMEAGAVTSVLAFDQDWVLAAIIGGVGVGVVGSFKPRFLFRRIGQRKVDETIKADRKKNRVIEEAEAEARRKFEVEYFMRRIQEIVYGQNTRRTVPRPPPDADPDVDYANLTDAMIAREREAMFVEERPWTTLNQRLLALDRLSVQAQRVRDFVQHKIDTGNERPLRQAVTDLQELLTAFKELKADGTPMPDDHERLKPEGARGGGPSTTPAGPLESYLGKWTETPAGRALYPPGEMPATAKKVRPLPGFRTYDVEGDPDNVRIGSTVLSAEDLAAFIESDPKWHGEPIRLLSCETGESGFGFAQQLADLLGVSVLAPSEFAFVTESGNIFVSGWEMSEAGIPVAKMPPTGKWYAFEPAVPRTPGPPANTLPDWSPPPRAGMWWPDRTEVEVDEVRDVRPVEDLGELTLMMDGPTVYTGGERLWPDELADVVADSEGWAGGPTRLQVQNGQVDPEFVQRLADLLGVPIVVPADAVAGEFPTLSSGTLEVYNEPARDGTPPGCRVYEPRNVAAGKGMS